MADEDKAREKARADANNAENIRNAASVAQASGHPIAAAVGTGVKAVDKVTGGKASEVLGKTLTHAAKTTPGAQKALNKLNESGAGDAIGKAAAAKAGASGGGAGAAGAKASSGMPKTSEIPKQGGIDKQQAAANKRDLSNKVSNAKNSDKANNQKDVEAIRNRQTNQADHNSAYRPASADRERAAEASNRGLPKKDGLDDNKGLGKDGLNNKDDGTGTKEDYNANSEVQADTEEEKQDLITKVMKFVKRRIILLSVLATVVIFIPLFLFTIYLSIIDNMVGTISTFFGISEADSKEGLSEKKADGIFTNPKIMYDPKTGEPYTREEMVAKLKADNDCGGGFISDIRDWFDGWDGNLSSVCAVLRHIEKYEVKREKEIQQKGITITLDRGLILSGLFYGFTKQPEYNDYDDPKNVDEKVPATEHFASLKSVIDKGDVLTLKDLDNLVDYSILDGSYDYYEFNPLNVPMCEEKHVDVYNYSSDKWKIFMRFGEDAANQYERVIQNNAAIESTDPECKYMLKYPNPKDETTYLVYANIENGEVDKFSPAEGLDGKVPLEYKNGYAYKRFPYYEQSINDPKINLEYDEVITPKDIESTITYLFTKKVDMNEILYFEDQDANNMNRLGAYIYGAYCGDYLTAPVDEISVKVTDCDGNFIRNTSFKDYIMGVAYGEVSDSGDNYVKSEMVAAISYALKRRNNYDKGSYITMRSGNCDQVYCPMNEGCYSKKANISCGGFSCTSYLPGGGTYHRAASSALISKYSAYYEEAKDYLVVKGNAPYSAHYVSSIQNGWKRKAAAGMHFSQIIAEEYGDEGATVIRCSEQAETNSTQSEPTSGTTTKTGNTASGEYPSVSPNYGKYYGFAYNEGPEGRAISIDPAWKQANLVGVKSNCSGAGWNKTYTVNTQATGKFAAAYANICKLLTNGVTLSDGSRCVLKVSDLQDGGTFVERKTSSGGYSLHAYGLAQDWNYSKSISVNGKAFKPYGCQGSSCQQEYQAFVRALGKEESCYNVNYIMWKYAYQPAGFNWGGNWSSGSWDGMHFEVQY